MKPRTLSLLSAAVPRFLYDLSYTFPTFGRLSRVFVRFIVHFPRFQPPSPWFCTIYRTLSLLSAADPRFLYDLSYTFPDFSLRHHGFVRFIVHFPHFRPPIQGFCTIYRTLSPLSAADPRFLYDLSYTFPDFSLRHHGFVRFIVHFTRFRPPIQGFCTIYRTLSPISASVTMVLYDLSYTFPTFSRRSKVFVRFIVHFPTYLVDRVMRQDRRWEVADVISAVEKLYPYQPT
jgi:hypothetical protein